MALYEIFVIEDPNEIQEGKEGIFEIRDTETYEMKVVRAIISRPPQTMESADSLRVRWQRGQPLPEPWSIKILEDMGSVGERLEIDREARL